MKVTNPHLLKDARIAKAAAAQIVNSPMTLPTEDYSDDDILSKDFVHLDIGDQSPKVRQTRIASDSSLGLIFVNGSFLIPRISKEIRLLRVVVD